MPAARTYLVVIPGQSATQRQQHRRGVIGHHVGAVVGDVRDVEAELGGGVDVDVVDANAVSHHQGTDCHGGQHVSGHLGVLHQDGVGARHGRREGGFVAPLLVHGQFGAELGRHGLGGG